MTASITVGLFGGLGNQLFQYATGLTIALRNGVPLVIDLYGFEFDQFFKRRYELEVFKIQDVQKTRLPFTFKVARFFRYVADKIPSLHYINPSGFIVESRTNFDLSLLDSKIIKPAYVMGYWNDERYFKGIQTRIKMEFTLRNGFSAPNRKLADTIVNAHNSVSLHCRRLHQMGAATNKIRVPKASLAAWSLGLAYYEKAVKCIATRIQNPQFFIFSDDPGWARENLKLDYPASYLENDRGMDYEDLILMSLCNHHIIANSSFSWWGAWLGEKDGAVIIAPANVKGTPNVPERWVSI